MDPCSDGLANASVPQVGHHRPPVIALKSPMRVQPGQKSGQPSKVAIKTKAYLPRFGFIAFDFTAMSFFVLAILRNDPLNGRCHNCADHRTANL